VQRSVHNGFVNIDITISNLQVEATLGISANPGLVVDGCPLRTKIGKGYQVTTFALLAFGETEFIQ